MKTLLITGGTGYIGSHGVVYFEQAGYKTIIVDNLSNSNEKQLNNISKILGYIPKIYKIDLRNKEELEKIFEENKIDGVVHFAGLKVIGESCQKPIEYFENNISGTINLFSCMKKYNVEKIIFSSSAAVYNQKIFKEKDFSGAKETNLTGNTTNPYGTTKYLIEQLLKDLAKFNDFSIINLRYFNPIGAHPSGYIGEDSNGIPNNLLPYIMKVATGELKELQIFGSDYPTEDGTGKRDYIDVNDLVLGHLKAWEKLEKIDGGFFETYNLGTGKSTSVLEMVKLSEKVSGQNISYKIKPRREGDLANVYCNPTKTEKDLNWKATTKLEESLKNSWKFCNK